MGCDLVEHLPGKFKALGSSPSVAKKNALQGPSYRADCCSTDLPQSQSPGNGKAQASETSWQVSSAATC